MLKFIQIKIKLRIVRNLLEKCWTVQTSYSNNNTLTFDSNNKSKGQCFVTSLLLYNEYYKKNSNNKVYIHRGCVLDNNGQLVIEDHCWLEIIIDKKANRYIIDLTLDQAPLFAKKVIFANKDTVTQKLDINYLTKKIYKSEDLKTLKPHTLYRYNKLLTSYFKSY